MSEILRSSWLSNGPTTREFEASFAEYVGTKHAIAVTNGTEALHLGLLAVGIRHGSEVIMPSFTCHAAANAILYCGARPVLVDVAPETICIDIESAAKAITPRTCAIVATHFGGHPCDMKPLMELAERSNLVLIEDAAHATGATYCGKSVGSLGHVGCFSFYPTKPMTSGEGGMITTDDSHVAKRLRSMRSLSIERRSGINYDVRSIGYTSRMSELQAALGIDQLRILDRKNSVMRRKADRLKRLLDDITGIVLPKEEPYARHIYNLFVIKVIREELGISRDKVSDLLHRKGIETQLHYVPIHRLTYFAERSKFKANSLRVSDYLWKTALSLPLYPSITNRQLSEVSEALHYCGSNQKSR